MIVHTVFDLLAAGLSALVTAFVYRWRLAAAAQIIENAGLGYAAALIAGAAIGGFGFGSLNLWLSGTPAIARSIVGALTGAIAAIEVFKKIRGIRGSSGLIFVPAFATSVVAGRWGCFLSGLEDQTYGVVTSLPWGHDFGDGIMRHPVQLYESFAMAAFLGFAMWMLARRSDLFMRNGFYIMVAWYSAQRFIWEFLKPYGAFLGLFNLFHFLCAGLMIYSAIMIVGNRERASP